MLSLGASRPEVLRMHACMNWNWTVNLGKSASNCIEFAFEGKGKGKEGGGLCNGNE